MREFFKGWRRKAGVITLVMALVLMGGWIRSGFVCDCLFVNGTQRSYRFGSGAGVLYVLMSGHEEGLPSCIVESHDLRIIGDFSKDVFGVWKFDPLKGIEDWRWEWAGFHSSEGRNQLQWMRLDTIPYWFPTLLLTSLSACLILLKPRSKKSGPVRN